MNPYEEEFDYDAYDVEKSPLDSLVESHIDEIVDSVACGDGSMKDSDWLTDEKRRLLEAIKMYGPTQMDLIKSAVRTRTIGEILRYCKRLKEACASLDDDSLSSAQRQADESFLGEDAAMTAKLLHWLERARRLQISNKTSDVLSPAFRKYFDGKSDDVAVACPKFTSVFGRFKRCVLDYSRIYRYLGALCSGGNPVRLTAIESELVSCLVKDIAQFGNSAKSHPEVRELMTKIHAAQDQGSPNSNGENVEENGQITNDEDRLLLSFNPFRIPEDFLK